MKEMKEDEIREVLATQCYWAVYTHPDTVAPIHEGWCDSIEDATDEIADCLIDLRIGAAITGRKPDQLYTVELVEQGEPNE